MAKLTIFLYRWNAAPALFGSQFMNKKNVSSPLYYYIKSRLRPALALLLLCLICASCAKQIELVPDRKKPLPSGIISAVGEHNGKSRYRLKIDYLIAPEDLDSNATTYIVWAQSPVSGEVEKVAVLGNARSKQIE